MEKDYDKLLEAVEEFAANEGNYALERWRTVAQEHGIPSPVIPEEPDRWVVVIKQDDWVPAVRASKNTWYYVTVPDRTMTWRQLMDNGTSFEILYEGE